MPLPKPSPDKRIYRIQFRFWLDVLRDEEHDIALYIKELKRKRTFIRTIRDSLTLIRDLRAGNVEALEKMFPFVKRHYARKQTQDAEGDDRLARIEQLLLEKGSPNRLFLPSENPRKANPIEDEIEIRQASQNEDDKPTWNFMISSNLSIYGHCNFLPVEIREYAVRTGRITPPKPPKIQAAKAGGPKLMDVPQFAPPSFDGEELEVPL